MRARRQYDAVDPDHRLVAAELERRWNEALRVQARLEEDLATLRAEHPIVLTEADEEAILGLGEDLNTVWNHAASSPELKKRIIRTLIAEIVVRLEGQRVMMILHWQGGDHEPSLAFSRTALASIAGAPTPTSKRWCASSRA